MEFVAQQYGHGHVVSELCQVCTETMYEFIKWNGTYLRNERVRKQLSL